jgi:hypothetical protein
MQASAALPRDDMATMRKIYFVKYNDRASSVQGGDHIAEALRARGHDAWTVSPSQVRDVRDAILVFIKTSRWWHLERARRNRNRTVLDIQDTLVFHRRIKNRSLFDGIIWRNRRQFEDFGQAGQANRILYHHWDPRYTANRLDGSRLAIGYLGVAESFPLWGKVPGVDCFDDDYFRQAVGYNCHISVRPPGRHHLYKPNCKVSTAAACEANLITTRDKSSEELLGDDYPYYVDSPAMADVLRGVEKARTTFGGPLWREGLARMAQVREKTSIERETDGYIDFFRELGAEPSADRL